MLLFETSTIYWSRRMEISKAKLTTTHSGSNAKLTTTLSGLIQQTNEHDDGVAQAKIDDMKLIYCRVCMTYMR